MTIKKEGSCAYGTSKEEIRRAVLDTLAVKQTNLISDYKYEIVRQSTDGFEISIRIKPKLWPLVLWTNMKIVISGDEKESRVVLSYRSPWFVMADALDIYNTYIRDFFRVLNSFTESKTEFLPAKKKNMQLDMELKLNWQTVTVFLLLTILIVVIGGRFYAFAKLEAIHTVDHIASNGRTVCIHHDDALHFLSVDGQLQKSIPLTELGLHTSPSDIELLNDDVLLVGDSQTKTIWKCDTTKKRCNEIAPSKGITINDNYKFAVDDKSGTLYISDTNNHRLIEHDLTTGVSEIIKEVKLKYPNDMTTNSEGFLQIADTQNSRIISVETVKNPEKMDIKRPEFLIDLERFPEPRSTSKNVEAISEKVIAGAVSSYPSPLALVQAADRNLWVVVTDAYINYGELWIFNMSGDLVNNISISKRSIPLDIIRLGDRILVTDAENNQVYSMNTRATRLDPFGDERFQDLLLRTRQERDIYRAVKNHSFKILGILLVAFLLMLLVIKRQQNRTAEKA